MNLMSKWVSMVNEETYTFPEENDDVSRTERYEMEADEYENEREFLKDIENANRKYRERNQIGEAEEKDDASGEGNWEKDFWKLIQSRIDKVEDGALRWEMVHTAGKILRGKRDFFGKLNDVDTRERKFNEADRKIREIVDDINDGEGSEEEEQQNLEKFKRTLEDVYKVEKTVSDLEANKARNDRIASGETTFADERKGAEEQRKRYYVFKKQEVYRFGSTKADTDEVENEDDLMNLNVGKYEVDEIDTKAFDTKDAARQYVKEEISKFDGKYNAPAEKHLPIHEKMTVKISKTRDYQADGLPYEIKKLDSNAVGFVYTRTEGASKSSDNVSSEGVWNRPAELEVDPSKVEYVERTIFSEFIIYKSEKPARFDGGMEDLADAIMKAAEKEEDDEYIKKVKERRERRKRMYQQAMRGLASLQKEVNQARAEALANEINGMIAKMEDEDILKALREFFKDKTDEEILNLTSYDFYDAGEEDDEESGGDEDGEEGDKKPKKAKKKNGKKKNFTIPQMKKVLAKLGKVKDEEDDEDDDENSNLDDYASSGKETKILSDDEIERLFKKASVDGYSTRGDETKAEEENRKDQEKAEEEEERDRESNRAADKKEADSDDYETSQDDTGSITGNMMNRGDGGEKREDSKLELRGVPITRKFLSYLQKKDKKDWPKTAEEVRKMKKQMKKDWKEND